MPCSRAQNLASGPNRIRVGLSITYGRSSSILVQSRTFFACYSFLAALIFGVCNPGGSCNFYFGPCQRRTETLRPPSCHRRGLTRYRSRNRRPGILLSPYRRRIARRSPNTLIVAVRLHSGIDTEKVFHFRKIFICPLTAASLALRNIMKGYDSGVFAGVCDVFGVLPQPSLSSFGKLSICNNRFGCLLLSRLIGIAWLLPVLSFYFCSALHLSEPSFYGIFPSLLRWTSLRAGLRRLRRSSFRKLMGVLLLRVRRCWRGIRRTTETDRRRRDWRGLRAFNVGPPIPFSITSDSCLLWFPFLPPVLFLNWPGHTYYLLPFSEPALASKLPRCVIISVGR
jgi:hypothetical protein